MKFLSLALIILLATGIQARALQADDAASSQLEHVKAVKAVMTQVKEATQRVLNHLDDTEYKEYKDKLSKILDSWQEYSLSTYESYFKEALGSPLLDATTTFSNQFLNKIEEMRMQLELQQSELMAILKKKPEDQQNMVEIRAKIESIMEEMSVLLSSKAEEADAELRPALETVYAKLAERLEELRTKAAPKTERHIREFFKSLEGLKKVMDNLSQDFQGVMEGFDRNVRFFGLTKEQLPVELMALYESVKGIIMLSFLNKTA